MKMQIFVAGSCGWSFRSGSVDSHKGMFERAVKEHAPIGRIWDEANGESCTNDELRIVRQIEGVTRARRNDRSCGAIDSLVERERAFGNVFIPAGKRFKHKIEVAAKSVNRARADIIIR